MIVNNVTISDINNCIKASKYPMSTDVNKCNEKITDKVLSLAQCKKGEGHDQFLTGIVINFDLTCSIKMWTEMERYRFVNFVSSQSTMHRINKFELNKQYIKHVDKRMIKTMEELKDRYNSNPTEENFLTLVYSNPVGFELTARLTTNYRALKTVYSQRKNHKLPEWKEFCKWIERLPYNELIIGGK